MSNFYLDILKDRLYTFGKKSAGRRSAQTVIYEILNMLNRIITPLLAFTSEEIYAHINKPKNSPASIHLCRWPVVDESKLEFTKKQDWLKLKSIREDVLKGLENRRSDGLIGNSLEAAVTLYTESEQEYKFLKEYEKELPSVFIVSQVALRKEKAPEAAMACAEFNRIFAHASKADGVKCMRCWNYSNTVGENKQHPQICDRCISAIKERN